MNLEFVGTPVLATAENAESEKFDLLITRDDGTTTVANVRAVQIHVGDYGVEAWMTTIEGQTHLAVASFRTLSVLDGGKLGKEMNAAVQNEQGELFVCPDEHAVVTPTGFETNEEIAAYILQQFQLNPVPVPPSGP